MDGGTQGVMGRLGQVGRTTSRVESTQMYQKCHPGWNGGTTSGMGTLGWELTPCMGRGDPSWGTLDKVEEPWMG